MHVQHTVISLKCDNIKILRNTDKSHVLSIEILIGNNGVYYKTTPTLL